MRHLLRLALALTVATTALIGPFAHAQGTGLSTTAATTWSYRDDDGTGRVTFTDLGPDNATGGRVLRVSLSQGGVQYNGSGISLVLEQSSSYIRTLLSFTLVSPGGRSYFFQGTTTSGITLNGQGTWHRVGTPENRFRWFITPGG